MREGDLMIERGVHTFVVRKAQAPIPLFYDTEREGDPGALMLYLIFRMVGLFMRRKTINVGVLRYKRDFWRRQRVLHKEKFSAEEDVDPRMRALADAVKRGDFDN